MYCQWPTAVEEIKNKTADMPRGMYTLFEPTVSSYDNKKLRTKRKGNYGCLGSTPTLVFIGTGERPFYTRLDSSTGRLRLSDLSRRTQNHVCEPFCDILRLFRSSSIGIGEHSNACPSQLQNHYQL
jgi:hypothetical protein